MRHAVIDVGSNTIRTVIHEIDKTNHSIIHNASNFAGIIGYIKDNRLSDDGIEILAEGLAEVARICDEFDCANIHCFATASLRNITNSREVLEEIRRRSGIIVEIISGEDEVLYDLAGLMSAADARDGIGLDLGGGSCQIFTFENKRLTYSVSLPIGSLKMYDKFSDMGDIEKIEQCVSEYVMNLLEEHSEFKNVGFSEIYAIGGTARVAAKVCCELKNTAKNTAQNTDYRDFISAEDIDMLLSQDMYERVYEILSEISPERKDSLFAGCAVLRAICEYTGVSGIRIVQAGVREGYLYSVLLKNNEV